MIHVGWEIPGLWHPVYRRPGRRSCRMVMESQLPGRSRPPAQRASLRVVYGYIRPHRLAVLVGALLSLATGATGLVLPLIVRALINDLSGHRGLSHLIVIMSLLMLADAVLGAAGGYLLLRTA